MIRAIIDTNIILDIALRRQPHFDHSLKIFDAIDERLLEGYITASSITDIYYIASKQKGKSQARTFILDLIEILETIGIDKDIVITALESDLPDFEDAIQVFSAKANLIDLIITRNTKDFTRSEIRSMEPEEFIKQLKNL